MTTQRGRPPRRLKKAVRKAVKKGLTENAVENAVELGLSRASSKKRAVGKAAVAEDTQVAKRA
jgi:hypothetical protein